MNIKNSRYDWADFTRSAAIFAVIVLHACSYYFIKFREIGILNWNIVNLLDSFVRWSVPIFFMLSGALILKESRDEVSLKSIFDRVVKVFLPLSFWSLFYLIYVGFFSPEKINWFSFLYEPSMYHLWFAYAMIGIYLMIPIWQALFNIICSSRKLQIYIFSLWIFCASLPIYLNIEILNLFKINGFLSFGGFFLLGAILCRTNFNFVPSYILIFIFALSGIVTAIITYYVSINSGSPSELAYNYLTINVIIASASLFLFFLRIETKGWLNRVFREISDLSFIIYFLHVLILDKVINFLMNNFGSLFVIEVVILSIFLTIFISIFLSKLIRLIPFSRKIFG